MKFLYFRQESGDGYLITYTIDSTTADIIILGSSRAKHSYVPEIFESNLNLTCFNAGRDGTEHVLFNYAQFKALTARYNPTMVIFDIRPEDLGYRAKEYDLLSPLLPYYKTHPEIKEIIDIRGPFEKVKHVSAVYPYNSLIFQVIMGNLDLNKERKPHQKGYIPFHEATVTGAIDTLTIIDNSIDDYKIKILKEIILTCQQNNTELVFVYSPTWHVVQKSFYDTVLSDLCVENDVAFLNYSNLPVFLNNPGYFFDRTHLNDEGARLFSTILTKEIMRTNQ